MKFLIIGGGSIGKRHLKNLFLLGHKELYCFKREVDKSFEQENKCTVITTYKEAKKIKFDGVFICTPTSLHNEALKFAVEQNSNIFMEKPLIHNKKGLKEAKSLLSNYSKVFFIGFMLRYHPLVKRIKEIIDTKILGEVYSARFEFGSYLPYWHPWEDYKKSYASLSKLGGGVINTITHELDLIQYYFGDPNKVVSSKVNLGKLDIEVEEMCEAIFIYSDKQVTLHLDYLQKDYDRNIKILCDEGKILWNWHENKIVVTKHEHTPDNYTLKNFDVNQLYIEELKDFINKINNNQEEHPLDKKQAFKNTRLMLKIHKNGTSKRTV